MILLLLLLCVPLILFLIALAALVWLIVTVTAAIFTAGLRLLSAVEVTHER